MRAEQHLSERDKHLAIESLLATAVVLAVLVGAKQRALVRRMRAHLGPAFDARRRFKLFGDAVVGRLAHVVIPSFATLIRLN
eukprot:7066980-Prymnesium_polylepis.1